MKFSIPSNLLEWRYYSYSFQKDKTKLSFDFRMKYEYHSEKRLVKIIRDNLLIHNEKPDETLIGNLVFQSSEALFPLILQINSFGYPIGIYNQSEILERWKRFIPRFQEYYDNPLSIKLLSRIGKLYKTPQKLIAGLQNDWFFSSFFFPVYGEYRNNEVITIDYPFPSVVGTTIYKTELLMNEEKTDKGKTDISIAGYSSNNEKNIVIGNFLLNSDRSIHEISLDFSFEEIRQNITIHIKETKEVLERKTALTVYDEKEEQEKLSKNKGFFIEEIESKNLPKHK